LLDLELLLHVLQHVLHPADFLFLLLQQQIRRCGSAAVAVRFRRSQQRVALQFPVSTKKIGNSNNKSGVLEHFKKSKLFRLRSLFLWLVSSGGASEPRDAGRTERFVVDLVRLLTQVGQVGLDQHGTKFLQVTV
jgi:hypothetical protein